GDYVRVPMMLMDAKAIEQANNGHAQLSVGYGARLLWGDGQTPAGEPYDAKQTDIRANHIALVKSARGGDRLNIMVDDDDAVEYDDGEYFDREFSTEQRQKMASKGQAMAHGGFPIANEQDLKNAIKAIGRAKNRSATIAHIKKRARALGLTSLLPENWDSDGGKDSTDNKRRPKMTERVIDVDGIAIELDGKDSMILERHLTGLNDKVKAGETKIGELIAKVTELTKAIETKDGENAALKKQLGDSELTPQKLDQAVQDRMDIVERAIRVLGDKAQPQGKTDIAIRREVVGELMSAEAVKDWSDDRIAGAFYGLTKPDGKAQNGLRAVADSFKLQTTSSHSVTDEATKAYLERNEQLRNAYRQRGNKQPNA